MLDGRNVIEQASKEPGHTHGKGKHLGFVGQNFQDMNTGSHEVRLDYVKKEEIRKGCLPHK